VSRKDAAKRAKNLVGERTKFFLTTFFKSNSLPQSLEVC